MVGRVNIAFARGGAHLPIAHAIRLPGREGIFWVIFRSGDFFGGGFDFFLGGSLAPFFFARIF